MKFAELADLPGALENTDVFVSQKPVSGGVHYAVTLDLELYGSDLLDFIGATIDPRDKDSLTGVANDWVILLGGIFVSEETTQRLLRLHERLPGWDEYVTNHNAALYRSLITSKQDRNLFEKVEFAHVSDASEVALSYVAESASLHKCLVSKEQLRTPKKYGTIAAWRRETTRQEYSNNLLELVRQTIRFRNHITGPSLGVVYTDKGIEHSIFEGEHARTEREENNIRIGKTFNGKFYGFVLDYDLASGERTVKNTSILQPTIAWTTTPKGRVYDTGRLEDSKQSTICGLVALVHTYDFGMPRKMSIRGSREQEMGVA